VFSKTPIENFENLYKTLFAGEERDDPQYFIPVNFIKV